MIAQPTTGTLSARLFAEAEKKPEPKYVTTRDSDAPQSDDDWPQIESEAAVIVENDNSNWWAKGELALRVERRYKEEGIKKLASETQLGAAKTLYEHAQLAEFFPPSARAQVPSLLKEHFKQAFRAVKNSTRKLQNPLGAAMGFLKQAEDSDGEMSAAAMGRLMKAEFGQPVKHHWRYEPDEGHVVGDYLAFMLPANLLKQIHDEVLAHQSEPTFKMTVSFSYTQEPKVA